MTWATNWDSSEGKGKLLKVALNELRAALDERSTVVGRTIPTDVSVISTGSLISGDWFIAFQSEITALIPLFVNKELTLDASLIANWTTATILAETTEGSRVATPVDPLVSATWLYQQYELLNLLVWTKENISSYSNGREKQGSGATWTLCKNAFDAYTWQAVTGTVVYFSLFSGGTYSMQCVDTKVGFTTDANYKHTSEIYCYSDTAGVYDYFNFADFDQATKYHLRFSYGEGTLSQSITSDYVMLGLLSTTPYPPDPSAAPGGFGYRNTLVDSAASRVQVVKKFDSTNGFEYK